VRLVTSTAILKLIVTPLLVPMAQLRPECLRQNAEYHRAADSEEAK